MRVCMHGPRVPYRHPTQPDGGIVVSGTPFGSHFANDGLHSSVNGIYFIHHRLCSWIHDPLVPYRQSVHVPATVVSDVVAVVVVVGEVDGTYDSQSTNPGIAGQSPVTASSGMHSLEGG